MTQNEPAPSVRVGIYFDPKLWRRIEATCERLGVSVDVFMNAAAWNACDATDQHAKKAVVPPCSTD